MQPRILNEYHIFLASPGDMDQERLEVRRFIEAYNSHTALRWNVRFTVVDWENYATIGVGRPQELITKQTLEKFKESLVLVVGLMGQRFGSPTGTHESGTKEEFEWALTSHMQTGFPEIKWFFRRIEKFEASNSDPDEIRIELEQWINVRRFRQSLQNSDPPVFYQSFSDFPEFCEVLREDLSRWLGDEIRPWHQVARERQPASPETTELSLEYFESVVSEFKSLDIAGIDNDRAVDIPLSEVYVRLRVIRDEDSVSDEDVIDGEPIDIHAALGKYKDLVIVGDPGSGKSTFLKFIALMLARAQVENDPGLASAKLNLEAPLPIPFFVSLWDLSDFLKHGKQAGERGIVDFITQQLAERRMTISHPVLEAMFEAGWCCLLFDGLDEIPTEQGRALVSRLVERFVGRYSKNRYVVTSRVRGYSGDTILKGGFVRCDIQNFNETDRQEFLKNWFAALLRVDRLRVLEEGTPSFEAYNKLRTAIEGKDRIRVLAVNPLLMTVIAIVHWNRKRLPDQRVDLYDECVDVLLGQRKTAERTGRYRTTDVFDTVLEEEVQYDRAWTRKRFAEIALRILESGNDEITRGVVISMLRQRLRDRPGITDERSMVDAERFLDQQELRSGLLVSRRSHSCRFVHLTFQEYLAAWNLANLNFEGIKTAISDHLRDPQWFETLQLLGGELAKVSDEKLDEYIRFLLDNLGRTVGAQAPLIALSANILRDVEDVADISAQTQRGYLLALRGTLDAFRLDSGVPARTQLEVLEALIPLGASVKEHLIQATKSSHFSVRTQAVTTLVSHLPDNDLFSMTHILRDRSQEPVFAYLRALLDRDKGRALHLLSTVELSGERAAKALLMCLNWYFLADPSSFPNILQEVLPLFQGSLEKSSPNVIHDLSWYLRKHWPIGKPINDEVFDWTQIGSNILRQRAINLWTLVNFQDQRTRSFLREIAVRDAAPGVREEALRNLYLYYDDAATHRFLAKRARGDEVRSVRSVALKWLAFRKLSEATKGDVIQRFHPLNLLTENFTWDQFIDPRVPIGRERVISRSRHFAVSEAEVERVFRVLAKHLPIKLTF